MRNVTISPSGKQIALITGNGDRNSAFTLSLDDPNQITPLVADSDDFHMQWCNWANDSRLLCSSRHPSRCDQCRRLEYGRCCCRTP
jgi:hypothetical protein